jgi:hypothetical protein
VWRLFFQARATGQREPCTTGSSPASNNYDAGTGCSACASGSCHQFPGHAPPHHKRKYERGARAAGCLGSLIHTIFVLLAIVIFLVGVLSLVLYLASKK